MPLIRSEITIQNYTTEVPRDNCVNVVYHTIGDSLFDPSVDYQNHADQMKTLFSGHATGSGTTFTEYIHRGITVKVYDMTDVKPRPERAVSVYTPTSWSTDAAFGPRQVALCLSYYSTRNLPRQRGRIFIGPLDTVYMTEVPPSGLYNMILDLGHGLFDIGGENVAHVVWSPTGDASHVVSDYWVNNAWDTMRSRLEKESSRVTLHP